MIRTRLVYNCDHHAELEGLVATYAASGPLANVDLMGVLCYCREDDSLYFYGKDGWCKVQDKKP